MGDTASCVCGDGRASGDGDAAFRQQPFAGMHPAGLPPKGPNGHASSDIQQGKGRPRAPGGGRQPPTGDQRTALATLADAVLRDATDPQEVERAFALGLSAGLNKAELEEAREAGLRAVARRRARDALARAVLSKEEDDLRNAVRLADEAMLDSREIEPVLAMIEELEASGRSSSEIGRRNAIVKRLESAIKRRGFQELSDAIKEAEGAGLTIKKQRAVLAEARVTLKMVVARREAADERRQKERQAAGDAAEEA
mmetsp:Transcript_90960/g.262181  ORF Transcript_90960/g.262181 Transcript_90960/m.262181 type:complete len:255 (+) Transcript_90960:51-815(+)